MARQEKDKRKIRSDKAYTNIKKKIYRETGRKRQDENEKRKKKDK